MRTHVLIAVALPLLLAGCYSKTVEEKQPIVVQQPSDAVVVPGNTTTVVTPAQ